MTPSKQVSDLHDTYPWLTRGPNSHAEYLEPEYYDELLHEYSFGGATDLDLLSEFLSSIQKSKSDLRVLELGCGSGRATDALRRRATPGSTIDLVDLSKQMVDYCRRKFALDPRVRVHQTDSLDYLYNDYGRYEVIVSLWNLSHSVHQHLLREGRAQAEGRVRESIRRMIMDRLSPGGSAFLIHYDIQSPEQRIINPWRSLLWSDADPGYDTAGQTPSKQILDDVLASAGQDGLIEFECTHHEGDPIEYESPDRALEVFMNFHMEGMFNSHPRLPEIVASLEEGILEHTRGGAVSIPPGCFTYKIIRQ